MSPTTSRMGHIKLASRYLQTSFARELLAELKKEGHSEPQAESLIIRLFNKGIPSEERYPPSIVHIFELTESAPMLKLRRAAEIAVIVGSKEMPPEHKPEIGTATETILRCITSSVSQAQSITDGVSSAIDEEVFINGHYGGHIRARRSAKRAFWMYLGFAVNPSGSPQLWNIP